MYKVSWPYLLPHSLSCSLFLTPYATSTYISLQLPGIFLLYHPLSPISFSQMHIDVDHSLGHEQPTKGDPQGRSDCHFLSSSLLPVALQLGMECWEPLLSHTATFNCIDFVQVTMMVMGSSAQVYNSHAMQEGGT